uniref:Uncharacterized protein n=1 Tax=Brassica oleracea var. oleracea TaxID=109376 RepID=A0A0D3AZX2_BRAOL
MKLNSFDKRKIVGEGLVSLLFKSVQQPFVAWHMVMRLIRLTNTSDSVQVQLGHVWKILYGIIYLFGDEYLRRPTPADFQRLLDVSEHHGFPIINLFGDEYLRRPTPEDLQRLLDIGEIRGFPEMIGSIDCMHWKWKNCPTAWKGQFSRGSGKPTIVLEAVASYDLWI